jgi:hypothetical protein
MRRSARIFLLFLLVFPACSYAAPFWEKPSEEARLTPAEHRELEDNVDFYASKVAQVANLTIKKLTRLREDNDGSPDAWKDVLRLSTDVYQEIGELEKLIQTQRNILEERKKKRQGANAAGMYRRDHLKKVMQDSLINDDELSDL